MSRIKQTLYLLLIMLIPQSSLYAGDVKQCKDLLLEEIKSIVSHDNGLLNAQLNLTTMKLAQEILKVKNQKSNAVNDYLKSLINNKTIDNITNSKEIQAKILKLYQEYSNEVLYDSNLEVLDLLLSKEPLHDGKISKLLITLKESSAESKFNQNDYAIAWISNKISQKVNNKESTLIFDNLNYILKDVTDDHSLQEKDEKNLIRNIVKNQKLIKEEFAKIKTSVFTKHKETCLNHYSSTNLSAQNESIFAYCKIDEQSIMDELFTKGLEDIINNVNDDLSILKLDSTDSNKNKEFTDKNIRKWQDQINAVSSNKEKIILYYQGSLPPKSHCSGFAIVDKKKQTISVHHQDGSEVFTSKSIIGNNKNIDGAKLNPDSLLRAWPKKDKEGNHIINNLTGNPAKKYSQTTGAGIYYTIKNLSENERKQRMYDKEFNGRVLPLSLKTINPKTGKYQYDEKIQAIHSIPNAKWIRNREARMTSFDNDEISRRRSAGCVNLEGYTYDIMNELMEHQCPIYVLPEDDDNYFFVKNRELNFGTKDRYKKAHAETVKIPDSDKTLTNHYAFTPKNLNRYTKSYKISSGDESTTLDYLLSLEVQNELYERAKIMENDQFEDFAKITSLLTNDPTKSKEIFLNLYNSYWRVINKAGINFDLKNNSQKINYVLERYQQDFDSSVNKEQLIEAMDQITFYH